ncbi:acyltransferase family protein [Edaphobacter modestus]|uniref:Peptidoglycan/LPS O-acetylase OafA/YrhL n=1 Tax=Edaphobacter modestus TaxID=388466 RepID=A0A4Q7YWU3_9BACT|nr:acyltransferase [Edaphobacter modestus]RZU41593.1 peptidoglycan/LPS O-acetylase OafA/YrhL [Edaphobacter modestus]
MANSVLAANAPSPQGEAAAHERRMPHIRALDGIRGLAIGLVLLIHLLQSNDKPVGSFLVQLIVKIKQSGWVGVDLFFALSGFLITGILVDSFGEERYFRNFYARRTLRIFPLYYGVLLILFLILRPTWSDGRQFYLLLVYLQNTALWWHGNQPAVLESLTGHLWSLAAEEQFYLVWPIIVFWVRDRRKLMWIAAGLVLAVPVIRTALLMNGVTFRVIYTSTLCRADSLLAGAWLALAVRGNLKERVLRTAPVTFSVAMLCCLTIAWTTGTFFWDNNPLVTTIGYSALAVAGASLIAMALRPGSTTGAIMNLSPLRWLGKYSYGIYIIHPMIGFLFVPWIETHIHGKIASHMAIFIATLLVTFPLAWVSYNVYERRFLRLKRYFA